jgi:hypothetical protein
MFESLKREAEAAQAAFERGYAQLFRDKDQQEKRYSDQEHQEWLRELEQERNAKLEHVEARARQERMTAEAQAATKDEDPSTLVSYEELHQANNLRGFINDEIQSLSSDALIERLQSVKDSEDRVRQFCYLHAARTRLQAAQARGEFPMALQRCRPAIWRFRRAEQGTACGENQADRGEGSEGGVASIWPEEQLQGCCVSVGIEAAHELGQVSRQEVSSILAPSPLPPILSVTHEDSSGWTAQSIGGV